MRHLTTKFRYAARAFWNFWTSQTGAFIIGVSAIVLAWYLAYINNPILKYDTQSVSFISSANENQYKVTVRGKEYKDLYQTKVYLRNYGQQALSGRDVSKPGHDPIRIVVPEEAGMVHFVLDNTETTEAITASLTEQEGELLINFDLLNPEYQIAVAVLHEKPTTGIEIKGSALNVNEITREWDGRDLRFWGLWGLGLLYGLLVVFYVRRHWRPMFWAKKVLRR